MPIFQDPDRQRFYDHWSDDHPTTEDGHQDDSSSWVDGHERNIEFKSSERGVESSNESHMSNLNLSKFRTSDREELIRYIKRADASTWAQRHLSGDTTPRHCMPHTSDECSPVEETSNEGNISSGISCPNQTQELASPAEIERPRSALHSGDFREGTTLNQGQQPPQSPLPVHSSLSHFSQLSSSPTTPWFATPLFSSSLQGSRASILSPEVRSPPTTRSRAPSLGSFSSSYVLKAPTSPLVYQANNTDLDFSPKSEHIGHLGPSDKANRRRTLPPETFRHLQSAPSAYSEAINFPSAYPPGKFYETLSSQAYPPRRSLTSPYSLQLASSVQTPAFRARRPSLACEIPSKAHAPLVGSYEESILRGRMSMNPSKPLDFTAQIGVLGKGKCKANLKCPPHVTVPFPAVFYSYPTAGGGRSIADDNPSPYVGLIDLDNSLPKDSSNNGRSRRRHHSPAGGYGDQTIDSRISSKYTEQEALRRREKRSRRAESPKCPPGGCYRIPQQGQLQIIIKNPNKTAVKLFLVPYDLSDMEPGTKTFIRQRSYSAGPIIDMPLTARKNYGTDRPEASLNISEDPNNKPILRYLIHLNICSPARGRFYLHSSIRVVFANRVPDGKEKLRNEIQHPDPRYTPYKPTRETNATHMNAKSEKGYRKPTPDQGLMPEFLPSNLGGLSVNPLPGNTHNSIPLNATNPCLTERGSHPFQYIPSLRDTPPPPLETHSAEAGAYNKLSKGDIGYGGYPFSSVGGPEAGESLLAKRLRRLDVQKQDFSDIN